MGVRQIDDHGEIRLRFSYKCLDAVQSAGPNQKHNVQVYACSGADNQKWGVDENGETKTGISDKYLTIDTTGSDEPTAGQNIVLAPCTGAFTQTWELLHPSDCQSNTKAANKANSFVSTAAHRRGSGRPPAPAPAATPATAPTVVPAAQPAAAPAVQPAAAPAAVCVHICPIPPSVRMRPSDGAPLCPCSAR